MMLPRPQWFHSYLHRSAQQQAEVTQQPDMLIRKALQAAVQLPRFQAGPCSRASACHAKMGWAEEQLHS